MNEAERPLEGVPLPPTREAQLLLPGPDVVLIDQEPAPNVSPLLYVKFQSGPVGEVGKNGVQVEDLLQVAQARLQHLDQEMPCSENFYALNRIAGALTWLDRRTADRRARGVEGQSRP